MDSKSIIKLLISPKLSSTLISSKTPMGLLTEFVKWILYVKMQRAMAILKKKQDSRLAWSDNHIVTKYNSIQQRKWTRHMHQCEWISKNVNIELKKITEYVKYPILYISKTGKWNYFRDS